MEEDWSEFSEYYAKYFEVIRRYIMAKLPCSDYTAEELAEDTFLVLQLKWNSISPHTPAVIVTWLYRTAGNKMRDFRKKCRRSPVIVDLDSEAARPFLIKFDEKLGQIDDSHDLQMVLRLIRHSLSESDWDFFVSVYLDDLPTAEIIKKYNINAGLFYARRKLVNKKISKIIDKYYPKKAEF